MKPQVKVSCVQFASEWGNVALNTSRMVKFIEEEAASGAELIVFPELANIGYVTPPNPGMTVDFEGKSYADCAMEYIKASETIPGPTTDAICAAAKKHGCYVVFGMSQAHSLVKGTIYNASVLVGPDGIIGVHHKMHACLGEKHFFYPGNTAEVFHTPLGNIGMGICYDNRFPEYTRVLALKGAEIVTNIWAVMSANAGAGGVNPDMNSLKYRAYTRAQENGIFYVNCNRTGTQGNFFFTGHSCVAAPNGTIIAGSDTCDEEVVRATLCEEDFIRYRSTLTIFRDRRPEMYGLITKPLSESYVPADVDQMNNQVFMK